MVYASNRETWALDVKWAPDPDAGRLLYHLSDHLSDHEVIHEMYRRNGACEAQPYPVLPRAICQILCLSAVIRKVSRNGSVLLRLHTLPDDETANAEASEIIALTRFLSALGTKKPRLVTFNENDSDLRLLIRRGLMLGLHIPELSTTPDKEWSCQHLSLAIDNDEPFSHLELTLLAGVPARTAVDGTDVAHLWAEGHLSGIIRYNEFDALSTYMLWLRFAHFHGFFDTESYRTELTRVDQMLLTLSRKERYQHLTSFRSALLKIAERRAPHRQI